MNFEVVLMAVAIHILFWEKLPEWGTFFTKLVAKLPKPLRTLYDDWRCAYCAGFWIVLVLHGLTGLWFLPVLDAMPDYLGVLRTPIGWVLDALAGATLVLFSSMAIKAIGLPAMKSHQMRAEFMESMSKQDQQKR